MTAITLELRPVINLTDEQFYQLCHNNPDIKLESNQRRIDCYATDWLGGTAKYQANAAFGKLD